VRVRHDSGACLVSGRQAVADSGPSLYLKASLSDVGMPWKRFSQAPRGNRPHTTVTREVPHKHAKKHVTPAPTPQHVGEPNLCVYQVGAKQPNDLSKSCGRICRGAFPLPRSAPRTVLGAMAAVHGTRAAAASEVRGALIPRNPLATSSRRQRLWRLQPTGCACFADEESHSPPPCEHPLAAPPL
jgi:hypothetical protein